MISGRNWTFENFGGTEEFLKKLKIGKKGHMKILWYWEIPGKSMISGKNKTFAHFGGSEEFRRA